SDKTQFKQNQQDPQPTFHMSNTVIHQLKFHIPLLNSQYIFHNSKLIFNFTSHHPLHFPNFLKILPHNLNTRIQLPQIRLP
ncbi:PSP1 C-terminal domain-containing protein, partial [Staphylococcus pettenkoferi]|uniref:PSP1 C-terminal domain-containing protein n=1 Tax=Staphylococcus pettenkoferi TaxID=170573 RepID=UPI0036F2991B